MTEQKKAEHKIQLYNRQLEQSNQALERFAYITSHDLKEPLRTIGSFASLLDRKIQAKGEIKEYIAFIMQGVERMNNLIEAIFDISKISQEQIQLNEICMDELMKQVEDHIHYTYHESKVCIQYQDFPKIKGDKKQLYLLFKHLLENAVKYNRSACPTIRVHCKRKHNFYEFSIKDNGIGIAPAYHEQVFMMFKRLHNQTTFKGTGIGLAVCSKIVDLHQGEIWVESQEGEGADFRFTIPV